jgi:hypothetical protein
MTIEALEKISEANRLIIKQVEINQGYPSEIWQKELKNLLSVTQDIEILTSVVETEWDSGESDCTITGLKEIEKLIVEVERILRTADLPDRVKEIYHRLLNALTHLLTVATDIIESEKITQEVRESRKSPPTAEEMLKIEQILKKAHTKKV